MEINDMNMFYIIYINILSGYFIIAGTFILSRNIFDNTMKKLTNYAHDQSKLPFFVKFAILSFGYSKKLTDINFWNVEYCPTRDNFSYEQQLQILEPFIGFIFIVIGTGLSIWT